MKVQHTIYMHRTFVMLPVIHWANSWLPSLLAYFATTASHRNTRQFNVTKHALEDIIAESIYKNILGFWETRFDPHSLALNVSSASFLLCGSSVYNFARGGNRNWNLLSKSDGQKYSIVLFQRFRARDGGCIPRQADEEYSTVALFACYRITNKTICNLLPFVCESQQWDLGTPPWKFQQEAQSTVLSHMDKVVFTFLAICFINMWVFH